MKEILLIEKEMLLLVLYNSMVSIIDYNFLFEHLTQGVISANILSKFKSIKRILGQLLSCSLTTAI